MIKDDLFQDEREPEGGEERRSAFAPIPVAGTMFKEGHLERVEKALGYLRKLWPEIPGDCAPSWALSFSGGFTDRDFKRGCEAAREARRLGFQAPTVSEFRFWCMGVTYPKKKADQETVRESLRNMRKKLRKGQ